MTKVPNINRPTRTKSPAVVSRRFSRAGMALLSIVFGSDARDNLRCYNHLEIRDGFPTFRFHLSCQIRTEQELGHRWLSFQMVALASRLVRLS